MVYEPCSCQMKERVVKIKHTHDFSDHIYLISTHANIRKYHFERSFHRNKQHYANYSICNFPTKLFMVSRKHIVLTNTVKVKTAFHINCFSLHLSFLLYFTLLNITNMFSVLYSAMNQSPTAVQNPKIVWHCARRLLPSSYLMFQPTSQHDDFLVIVIIFIARKIEVTYTICALTTQF